LTSDRDRSSEGQRTEAGRLAQGCWHWWRHQEVDRRPESRSGSVCRQVSVTWAPWHL